MIVGAADGDLRELVAREQAERGLGGLVHDALVIHGAQ